MQIRTHEEWEQDTKAAFAGRSAASIRAELARLERKRHWTHAEYSRFDTLCNALADTKEN